MYQSVFLLLVIIFDHVNGDRHTKHAMLKYCITMKIQRPLFIFKIKISKLSIHKRVHINM